MHKYLAAYEQHKAAAQEAYALFEDMTGKQLCRVPGMDTIIRLAWRIECSPESLGRPESVERAAAREYVYRWNLALQSPVFGVPHALGL